jgi:OOP family OmpA-OmpF porin
LAAATPAVAADEYKEMRPYVSGLYSLVFEEDRRDTIAGGGGVEEGKGFQLSAGKSINRYLGVELAAFGHNYGQRQRAGQSFRDYGAKIDGLFFYDRDPRFSPYFGLGVGSIQTDLKNTGNSSTDPFADVGIGFMKFFDVSGTELGFRTDLRYRRIFLDENAFGQTNVDDLGEAVLNVGFVVPLGPKPAPAAKPADSCPDTDGDGVCDSADLCPETPKGTVVDAKGCPADPKTDKNDPNQKFEDVYFPFDRYDLTDYAKGVLDNAAKVIGGLTEKNPSLQVDVSGHTDWIGTDGYNQGLSERRANSVKQYLIRKGIDGGRINTFAYGEARPKATNETEEGRALNRRSEVRTHLK